MINLFSGLFGRTECLMIGLAIVFKEAEFWGISGLHLPPIVFWGLLYFSSFWPIPILFADIPHSTWPSLIYRFIVIRIWLFFWNNPSAKIPTILFQTRMWLKFWAVWTLWACVTILPQTHRAALSTSPPQVTQIIRARPLLLYHGQECYPIIIIPYSQLVAKSISFKSPGRGEIWIWECFQEGRVTVHLYI